MSEFPPGNSVPNDPSGGIFSNWQGGVCPVSPDTLVSVILRNRWSFNALAGSLVWGRFHPTRDIVAYKNISGPAALAAERQKAITSQAFGDGWAAAMAFVHNMSKPRVYEP